MTYQTLECVLRPDGTVSLPPNQLPSKPVRVMVTMLESTDENLSDLGDYASALAEYEDRLARGEIQWQ